MKENEKEELHKLIDQIQDVETIKVLKESIKLYLLKYKNEKIQSQADQSKDCIR